MRGLGLRLRSPVDVGVGVEVALGGRGVLDVALGEVPHEVSLGGGDVVLMVRGRIVIAQRDTLAGVEDRRRGDDAASTGFSCGQGAGDDGDHGSMRLRLIEA